MATLLSSRIIGLPVLDIGRGKRLGSVRAIVLDSAEKRVAALSIQLVTGWWKRGLIAVENVYAIGEQAVTVEGEEHIVPPDPKSHLGALARRGIDLRGTPLVTLRGQGLGVVAEYEFDLSGAITALHIQHRPLRRLARGVEPIPGGCVRAFGADAVIVSDEAQRLIAPEESSEAREETARHTGWLAKLRAARGPAKEEQKSTPTAAEPPPGTEDGPAPPTSHVN